MPANASRRVVLAAALSVSGLLSGVAFGWAALVVMMKREGAYAQLCDDDDDDGGGGDDDECASQEVALSRVFSIGILCLFASRLPLGVAVDRAGCRVVASGSCLLAAAGCLLFAEARYAAGFGLLSGAGPGVHISAMHISNLFPERRKTVLGAFSTAHQVSTFLFSLWLPVFSSSPRVSLAALFRGYAALLVAFAAVSALIQPRSRYRLGDAVAFRGCRAVVVAGEPYAAAAAAEAVVVDDDDDDDDDGDDGGEAAAPSLYDEVRAVARTPGFAPFLAYKASSLLSMQFFVAVLQYRLSERGDRRAASLMNLAFNLLASFLGLFVAAPLVGPVLDLRADGARVICRAATAQAVGFNALLALASWPGASWPLLAELPSYVLWASSRICFFAFFFAHVVALFGFDRARPAPPARPLIAGRAPSPRGPAQASARPSGSSASSAPPSASPRSSPSASSPSGRPTASPPSAQGSARSSSRRMPTPSAACSSRRRRPRRSGHLK